MNKETKVCCNCLHCIRILDKKYNIIMRRCEEHDRYLSYKEVMFSGCKTWEKEKEGER